MMVSVIVMSKIKRFKVCVSEQNGLCLTWQDPALVLKEDIARLQEHSI